MQLYLIRHGKTVANDKHLYCGSTDLPLSENGIEELKNFHYRVPSENIKYMTSGMLRTEQTLKILFGDVEYAVDDRFREMDFGIFEMHSYEELKSNPEYQKWITGDNEANICPEGESGNLMRQRVLEGLRALMGDTERMNRREVIGNLAQTMPETHNQLDRCDNVVLIAHGGTIAIIMEYLFPEERKNRYSWQPRTGCGYLVTERAYLRIPEEGNG